MLLQVLSSVHSERQLVEQINDNLLFRCFVGPSIEDAVWNHCGSRQGLRHARLRAGVPQHEGEPCVYPTIAACNLTRLRNLAASAG